MSMNVEVETDLGLRLLDGSDIDEDLRRRR
jgi:hypothetical protein